MLQRVKDFAALRPFVTLTFLRVIWYAYVAAQTLRFLGPFSGIRLTDLRWDQWIDVFLISAAYPILNILLVRVLLEVAAVVLLGRGYAEAEPKTKRLSLDEP